MPDRRRQWKPVSASTSRHGQLNILLTARHIHIHTARHVLLALKRVGSDATHHSPRAYRKSASRHCSSSLAGSTPLPWHGEQSVTLPPRRRPEATHPHFIQVKVQGPVLPDYSYNPSWIIATRLLSTRNRCWTAVARAWTSSSPTLATTMNSLHCCPTQEPRKARPNLS